MGEGRKEGGKGKVGKGRKGGKENFHLCKTYFFIININQISLWIKKMGISIFIE